MLTTGTHDDASGIAGGSPAPIARPPAIPPPRRRVRLYPGQWIGLPVLALLPLLAMAGAFGGMAHRAAEAGGIQATVEYPARIRTGQVARIEVVVRNLRPALAENVRVRFQPGMFDGAANLLITPAPESPLDVRIPRLEAGGEGHVRVEFRWEHLWLRTGSVVVEQPGGAALRLPVRSFIFP